MKAASAVPAAAPRFDVNALRELAGEQVFVRGEVYHSGGAVQLSAWSRIACLPPSPGPKIILSC